MASEDGPQAYSYTDDDSRKWAGFQDLAGLTCSEMAGAWIEMAVDREGE